MSFEKIYRDSEIILTEGALAERLKTEFGLKMDEYINHAGVLYSEPGILESLYRQYIDIGKKYNLPIMIMGPTRKVNSETIEKSNFNNKNIISDSCSFLKTIKESYHDYAGNIMIGGLMGCKGDAYSGKKIPDAEASYLFHKQEARLFQKEEVDFLFAGIMPEINEATGMARAMAETGIPYIISFMIQKDGCLLDGTALADAIQIIDEQVKPAPICYMTNCIHPSNLIAALNNDKNKNRSQLKRFRGIQANASMLSYEELNHCNTLQQDDFKNMVEDMYYLKKHFDLKIFGGCCGTNDAFLEDLARKIADNPTNRTSTVLH